MKKENRLKKRKEFAYIFKNGERISSASLVLVYTKSKLKQYKVGFSCSKKVGKAVARNKVKRRLKHIVQANRNKLVHGTNYVFIAKQNSAETDFESLTKQVQFLLDRASSKLSK